MSYILYSSIARAGGIDYMLGLESFARPHSHPVNRRSAAASRGAGRKNAKRLATLRRQSGQALIGLGRALTRWGRHWAPQGSPAAANTNLSFAAE